MDMKTHMPTLEGDPDEICWHLRRLIFKLNSNLAPPPSDPDDDFENSTDESGGHA
jgi:hypothetical protein